MGCADSKVKSFDDDVKVKVSWSHILGSLTKEQQGGLQEFKGKPGSYTNQQGRNCLQQYLWYAKGKTNADFC